MFLPKASHIVPVPLDKDTITKVGGERVRDVIVV
jgi:hypothetical protein